MPILKIFAASFMVALSGAMMPGPLLTVTVSQTVRRGFIASVLLMIGHALLELVLVAGLIFGLGGVLKNNWVMGAVTLLGGMMLIWMGWGMIRDVRRGVLDLGSLTSEVESTSESRNVEKSTLGLVLSGMVISISNPYWLIWWATVGLTGLTCFRALVSNPIVGISSFYIGHITGDLIWYLAIGAAVSGGRRVLSQTVYNVIVQVCGAFLVVLGFSFEYLLASGNLWRISMAMNWINK